MFFNQNKKIAKEISTVLNNTLRVALLPVSLNPTSYQLNTPYGFWMDEYVIGFTRGLLDCLLGFEFGGKSLGVKKCAEIRALVFSEICGDDFAAVLNKLDIFASQPKSDHPDCHRGADNATTLYGTISGRLKADDPDPILAQAHQLAANRHDEYQRMGLIDGSYTSLAAALAELTIGEHVRIKFAN